MRDNLSIEYNIIDYRERNRNRNLTSNSTTTQEESSTAIDISNNRVTRTFLSLNQPPESFSEQFPENLEE